MALAHPVSPVSFTALRHTVEAVERKVESFLLSFAKAFHAARAAERAYDRGALDRRSLEEIIG
jgi:hypothetical protein